MNEKIITYYVDEDALGDLFCNQEGCRKCFGSDHNGEPNGCGCDHRDKFIDMNRGLLVENSLAKEFYKKLDIERLTPPKYETPDQYKDRTGKDYPDDAPVYFYFTPEWVLDEYWHKYVNAEYTVIANEHGKPPLNYKGEKE